MPDTATRRQCVDTASALIGVLEGIEEMMDVITDSPATLQIAFAAQWDPWANEVLKRVESLPGVSVNVKSSFRNNLLSTVGWTKDALRREESPQNMNSKWRHMADLLLVDTLEGLVDCACPVEARQAEPPVMGEQSAREVGARAYREGKTLPMLDEFVTATKKIQDWMIEGWLVEEAGHRK